MVAKEVRNGITYINGIPADEFNKRCKSLHETRGVAPAKKRGRPRKKPVEAIKTVIETTINPKPRKLPEWDLAFRRLRTTNSDRLAIFTPMTYDSKKFPVSDSSYGFITFEGYLTAVMQPGVEYTVGDIVRMFSAMFEITPNARQMLEDTMARLLAWGAVEYSDGYKNFKRTNVKFTNLITLEDIGGWKELKLYSPEGELITTYNTEGETILYVAKTYCIEKEEALEAVYPQQENQPTIILADRPEFSEDMTFGEAMRGVFTVVKRIIKNSFK